jgi:DNA-directed RNA polymerase specialized sigma24 family protein
MSALGHAHFERLISDHYERLKDEVLVTVRAKLAVDNLHPDRLDLEAAYNAAWHALYEQSKKGGAPVSNLGGWLATISYRRAIDDIRSSQIKHRALATERASNSLDDGVYEPTVDDEIANRERYRQWLLAVRLRLNAREQQAVSLCILHEYSRKDASELMGIDVKRLDKVMTAANKKLGGTLEAISRGDWCLEQRSLIKAYALGLHEHGGERHTLALQHVMECKGCAAYVRSVRGLAGAVPPPVLLASALGTSGGILVGLSGGAVAGGAGTAAGGGGAALLGGIGAKTAAVCVSAFCAASGAVVAVHNTPAPSRSPQRPEPKLSANRPTMPTASAATTPLTARTSSRPRSSTGASTTAKRRRPSRSARTTTPNPTSKAAQEIAELGIEPQATSASNSMATGTQPCPASAPRPATASEFDFEGG